jgi:hypothetical protein
MDIETAFFSLFPDLKVSILPEVLHYAIVFAPIIMVGILAEIFWYVWVRYVQGKQFLGLKYTTLELKLPKDTYKSPLAMELFLNSLHNISGENWFSMYWKGETRPWYSLELISIEGQVKFFLWTEDRRKVGIMAALYGQFPEIEITEREDYTRGMHFDPKTMKVWVAEFVFSKEKDGKAQDYYPIKTYVDFGLDKDPKEEFKVDPMVPMIEFLGTVPANQQIWIQYIIRGHKKDQRAPGHLFKQADLWREGAEKEINRLMMRDPKTKVAGEVNPDTGFAKLPSFTKGEQEIVSALERSIQKLAFDVGIRAVYIAPKATFDTPFGVGGIISSFNHFKHEHLNGFKPNGGIWHPQLTFPWHDYRDMRRNDYSERGLKAYKRRAFFYAPFNHGKKLVLNTEELATMYHFPGAVAGTPTLERIPSKKSDAPSNLPV